jgi:GH25 family lysozyme M1 (1,4-beta-N-acetylmuramidase)
MNTLIIVRFESQKKSLALRADAEVQNAEKCRKNVEKMSKKCRKNVEKMSKKIDENV